MDFSSLSMLVFCLLPSLLLLWKKHYWTRTFPPGPPALPIVGNLMMMGQMTHRGLAKLAQRYGGLFHLRLGFLHVVTVSTPEMAQQVLQVHDVVFSNRPATVAVRYLTYDRADFAFAHYGPYWRQMRKLCVMKLFSRKRAESWASVREEVDTLLRSIAHDSGTPVDVGQKVLALSRGITYRAAFGTIYNERQDEFVKILEEFSQLMGVFNMADFIPWLGWIDPKGLNRRMVEARAKLDCFIGRIIDDHVEKRRAGGRAKKDDETDMVDGMLAYLAEDGAGCDGHGDADELQATFKLTRDNIKAVIMDLMFGGTETVASAIEWAMAEMLKRPEELKKVQEELEEVVGLDRKVHESDLEKLPYLKCTIKEILRLHPPIPLLLHETAADSHIDGYFIPAGSRITINVWAIGRDKGSWEDADVFQPARFAKDGTADFKGSHFEFIPFGSGRRSCPGMALGHYTLELAVAHMAHSFMWTLPNGMKPSELDMNDVFGLAAYKAIRLVAVPTPRLRCPLF